MRTLVVSDLHLGTRTRGDVLTRSDPLDALLEALDDVDRLLLLGDVVELMGRGRARAMAVAEPVLRAIGQRLGAEREVVLVPGNHDRALVRPWLRRVGAALAVDSRVPVDASAELSAVTAWLGPARVSVRYPGVWLRSRVWATHGHYLNRHLLPASSIGINRGWLGRPPREGGRPIDYERPGAGALAGPAQALSRWATATPHALDHASGGLLGGLSSKLGGLARALTMPRVPQGLLRRELAPLNASLLKVQMTHASLPALAHVVQRLGIDADCVVFGHVHRLGPLSDDDPSQWEGPGGRPRMINCGSWLYEPLLVHHAMPPHPYWPGGAVKVESGEDPRAVGLLDGLAARAMV